MVFFNVPRRSMVESRVLQCPIAVLWWTCQYLLGESDPNRPYCNTRYAYGFALCCIYTGFIQQIQRTSSTKHDAAASTRPLAARERRRRRLFCRSLAQLSQLSLLWLCQRMGSSTATTAAAARLVGSLQLHTTGSNRQVSWAELKGRCEARAPQRSLPCGALATLPNADVSQPRLLSAGDSPHMRSGPRGG